MESQNAGPGQRRCAGDRIGVGGKEGLSIEREARSGGNLSGEGNLVGVVEQEPRADSPDA